MPIQRPFKNSPYRFVGSSFIWYLVAES